MATPLRHRPKGKARGRGRHASGRGDGNRHANGRDHGHHLSLHRDGAQHEAARSGARPGEANAVQLSDREKRLQSPQIATREPSVAGSMGSWATGSLAATNEYSPEDDMDDDARYFEIGDGNEGTDSELGEDNEGREIFSCFFRKTNLTGCIPCFIHSNRI